MQFGLQHHKLNIYFFGFLIDQKLLMILFNAKKTFYCLKLSDGSFVRLFRNLIKGHDICMLLFSSISYLILRTNML